MAGDLTAIGHGAVLTAEGTGTCGEAPNVQIALEHVTRSFGSVRAIDDISLAVRRGGFVAILGPSGCGKSTLLRIIVGLDRPDTGRVMINGLDVTRRPPNKRPTNLVFQHGALFPHLTVFDNVAYGLRRQGWGRERIRDRVKELLNLVQLEGFESRRPSQLSGGQARRVGLARALAPSPQVLLLDEPLSALDLKLRKEMQLQLRRIHKEVGSTFIYVTHDQEEALVMSDRIVVMRAGRIAQDATPREIYTDPASIFVAGFIGETNLLAGTTASKVGALYEVGLVTGDPVRALADRDHPEVGSSVIVSVRPELVRIDSHANAADDVNALLGSVEETIYLGDHVRLRVRTKAGTEVWAHVPFDSGAADLVPGDTASAFWRVADGRLLAS
jgi:spermidine/putrescine ABC transporter ATP-binding subunit